MKKCRICKRPFVDKTKPQNAKTCSRVRCKRETIRQRVIKFRAKLTESA